MNKVFFNQSLNSVYLFYKGYFNDKNESSIIFVNLKKENLRAHILLLSPILAKAGSRNKNTTEEM